MGTTISDQLLGTSKRLKQFMQQLPHAVFLVDQNGHILEVNEILLRATGYSRQDLIHQPFQQILTYKGTIQQLYQALFDEEEQQGSAGEVEWRSVNGIGGKTTVMAIAQQTEEVSYLVHLFQLTKEQEMSIAHRLAQALTNSANVGLVVLDQHAHIIEINQMGSNILGVDRMQVLNQHVDEVFASVPEEHRLVKRELLEGVKQHNVATSWTNSNQRYELIVDSNTLQDEMGKTVAAYVFFKDITNLRSFEQKIERSDRLAMIGQIAAGTAHEIRNPLTSIKGFLQMFTQTFNDLKMDRERSYAEIMLMEIDRINALVSEFLLLSKPRDVQYSLVDLNTVFSEILPIVESEALLNGIQVKYSSHGGLPMVVGDNELLKQVFLNISKNGIEAMGNQGTLEISHHFDQERDKISVNVRDTGPGIPPYVIDKIFDPFYTTKEEGTGLGLAVCQKIVHDIGGQIRVSSKGFGTTFHILLPYV